MRPLIELVRKEFLQLRRDPALLRMVLVLPFFQLLVFGYAANTDLKNVRLSPLDDCRSEESRLLIGSFYSSGLFVPGPLPVDGGDIERLLEEGKSDVGVWIPRGLEEDLAAGRPAVVGVFVDGTNSSSAGRTQGYVEQILLREGMRLLAESGAASGSGGALSGTAVTPGAVASGALSAGAGTDSRVVPPTPAAERTPAAEFRRIEGETRFFYNPDLRSRNHMVPGIVVLIITIISMILTGVAVVREREAGTLEQLLVSPLTPAQLIAGKTIPFAIIAFVELAIATTFAVLWFRIPLEGSVLLLAFSALVYLVTTLGGGLLASTVSSTQQQAMFVTWFFLVFGILLSGFFYPIANMPRVIQYATYVNPLRYMMSMVRGIFLREATLVDVLPDLLRLAGIGVATFGLAVLRFRKRIG